MTILQSDRTGGERGHRATGVGLHVRRPDVHGGGVDRGSVDNGGEGGGGATRGVGRGSRDDVNRGDARVAGDGDHVADDRGDGAGDVHQGDGDLGHGLGSGRGEVELDLFAHREVGVNAGGGAFEVGGGARGGVGR